MKVGIKLGVLDATLLPPGNVKMTPDLRTFKKIAPPPNHSLFFSLTTETQLATEVESGKKGDDNSKTDVAEDRLQHKMHLVTYLVNQSTL